MIDQVDVEEDDEREATRWDGSPHVEKRSVGKAGPFLTEQARDALIGHIAMLQARLERYEPGGRRHHHTGKVIGAGDQLLRAQLRASEARLASVQAELRIAEDAIREHIRQKARLRQELEDAHAGRGGRAAGGRGDASPDAADADVAGAPPDAPGRVAPTPAVVDKGDAEHPAGGVAVERAVPAKAEPEANAAPHGPIRRGQKGGILIALAALGEATVEQLVAYTGSNRGAVAMNLKNNAARIDSWHIDGRRKAYRLKAG